MFQAASEWVVRRQPIYNCTMTASLINAAVPTLGSFGTHLHWAVFLLAAAVILFFIEIMVPSGGVLSVISLVCLGAGVFFLFKVDTTLGLIGGILSLIAIPFAMAFGLKMFPNTPFFRLLELRSEKPAEGLGEHGIAGATGREQRQKLIGMTGKAVTDLRPIGTCVIDGERQDCLASRGTITRGATVRVVSADGMQVKVEEVE